MFKGSGFYITDYRSEGYKKRASEDKPAASSGTADAKSGGEAKGETKAAKAESAPANKSPAKSKKTK
jgi:predicted nucleic acid-binding Zn ribbon protein